MSETVNEQQTVKSHSEQCILEGCMKLMQRMYNEIAYRLEDGNKLESLFEHEETPNRYTFQLDIALEEIVYELFLSHTFHSGMTSRIQKLKELGFYKDYAVEHFVIDVHKPCEEAGDE